MYKILIVDDEIMIRSGLSKIIRWNEIGFELVGAVGSAGEALKMIAQIPVDAILTDINMPDMTGLELIRRARKELPRVKAVIISGYSEFEYAREAIELKVENYILKPLDPQKITETFKKIREKLDEESYTERQNQFIQSEYEMRKGGSPENKGCEDEKQAELIRILEEGKYKEMETFVERWFVSFRGENGMEIRDYCYRTLRNAAFYFHIETPPLFKIYRIPLEESEDPERLQQVFQEDLQLLATCLKDNSESLSVLVSSKAKLYIDENYQNKNLSPRDAADKLNVSYGYLSTAFARTYGENFKSYLVSVRMEKARKLLMERRYKIYEIADMTGYASSRYFTDAFKKRYGISPGDYVLRMNGEGGL